MCSLKDGFAVGKKEKWREKEISQLISADSLNVLTAKCIAACCHGCVIRNLLVGLTLLCPPFSYVK